MTHPPSACIAGLLLTIAIVTGGLLGLLLALVLGGGGYLIGGPATTARSTSAPVIRQVAIVAEADTAPASTRRTDPRSRPDRTSMADEMPPSAGPSTSAPRRSSTSIERCRPRHPRRPSPTRALRGTLIGTRVAPRVHHDGGPPGPRRGRRRRRRRADELRIATDVRDRVLRRGTALRAVAAWLSTCASLTCARRVRRGECRERDDDQQQRSASTARSPRPTEVRPRRAPLVGAAADRRRPDRGRGRGGPRSCSSASAGRAARRGRSTRSARSTASTPTAHDAAVGARDRPCSAWCWCGCAAQAGRSHGPDLQGAPAPTATLWVTPRRADRGPGRRRGARGDPNARTSSPPTASRVKPPAHLRRAGHGR